MNKLIEFFAKQGIFADLLTFFIVVLGIMSMFQIKREAFPNINFDIITIRTIFPGASPEEVERLVTNLIERELKEVDGIKKLGSTSTEGMSVIVVQLDPDQTDAKKGKDDIQEVIDRITDFPKDTEDPVVTSVESKLQPIIEVSVSSDVPEMELRTIAKNYQKRFEKIRGIARVVPTGLRDVEVRVEANLEKLSRYRLSLEDLIRSLNQQNLSIPGGNTETDPNSADERQKIIRTIGEFQSLKDIENTVVRANDLGDSIKVKDIAKVYYSLEKAEILNRTDGKSSISLTILKKETADVIDLVELVKQEVNLVRAEGETVVDFNLINDLSYYIKRRLNILSNNLAIGLILVLMVLSLVLPVRVALVVSIGIPLSFLSAIFYFYYNNYSLNLLSMMGLIIVIGMLVDDAIVVTENAYRHMEEGLSPQAAGIKGAQEVWAPVTASVLTTVFAFLPMMFMTGIFGKFVKFIPLGVICALIASLFECFFILPYHVGRWIKLSENKTESNSKWSRIARAGDRWWNEKLVPTYITLLKKILKRKYSVCLATFGLFVLSIFIATTAMRLVLFPPEGIEVFMVKGNAPVGTSLERTAKLIEPIEAELQKLPPEELENFVTTLGIQQQDVNDPNTKRGSEYALVKVFLTPANKRKRQAKEIISDLRKKVGVPEGFESLTFDRINPGPPVGKPVNISVRGDEYEEILPAIRELKEFLSKIDGVTDLHDSYTIGKEEFRVKINPTEAAAAGLTVATIGNTVRAAYEGLIATSIQKLDDEIEIRVSLPRSDRKSEDTLKRLLIPNSLGNLVPLSNVSRIEKTQGIAIYEHDANERQVKILGDIDVTKTSASEVVSETKDYIKKNFKHPKVSVYFGGEDEDTKESLQSLGRAFGIAFFCIFLILILNFKQVLQPILVVLTIPLGIVSIIWTFLLHGMPISFMGMLGIIALGGVIVNNAIVYISFVNQRRESGESKENSIIEAARSRVRPIFLTTLTTVFGILPTAYGLGGLDPFVVPIALALGWGLFFGSLLTTLVFPAAVSVLDDASEFMRTRFMKKTR